jgi:triphosphoribosyl-dephospho-CoA synthase
MPTLPLLARVADRTAGPWSTVSSRLASLAVRALVAEADLTPKPALVDRRGPGAHKDLDLDLLHRSARSLFPCFKGIAEASAGQVPGRPLRERLAAIGREGERTMLAATGGSNSHKGAIWSLGLLTAGTQLCQGTPDPFSIASAAGLLASFPDAQAPQEFAHGVQVKRKYGIHGARGEAEDGFPHVVAIGLPALREARARGVKECSARLDALMAIMAGLDDTCLLHRGGLPALEAGRTGAERVLQAGGTATAKGMDLLLQLDAKLLTLNASPGGSADLLAATLFLDWVSGPPELQPQPENHGDPESWKN